MIDLKSLIPRGHKREHQVPVAHEKNSDPFAALRREMDHVFDSFRRGFGDLAPASLASGSDGWFPAMPSIDVEDTKKKLVVSAELPGVDEKDVEVTLVGDVLTIRGEKKYDHEEKDGDRHYVERRYGSFSRQVRLPFEAGDEDIDAKFIKGVLTIEISKPAEMQAKTRHIPVKG